MGYSQIKELATDVETAFATDQPESWRAQTRLVEGSVKLRTPIHKLEDMSTVARLHDRNHHRNASQFGAGLSASFYLEGLASALNLAGTYTAPGNDLGEILLAAFGAVRGGVGSKTNSTTSTTINLDVDSGTGFASGGACAIYNSTSGKWEFRPIITVTSNALALRSALGFTPNTDDLPVINATTFYLDEDGVGGDGQSLAIRIRGYAGTDQWIFRGCVPSRVTFKTPLDDYAMVDVDFSATTWANTSGETAASSVLGGSGPIVGKTGAFHWIQEGATVHNQINCHEISIDPGFSIVPERAFDGIQTVKRFRMMRQKPQATMTSRVFRGYSNGLTTFDYFWTEAATESAYLSGAFLFGQSPIISGSGTGMFAVEMPRMQYAKEPELVDEGDGFQDVKFTFDCDEDNTTTGSTDLTDSALRLHVF